jgi:hypothetical protein
MAYIFSYRFDFDVVFPADQFLNLTDGGALFEKAQDPGANRIESKHLPSLDIQNNGAVRSIDTAQLLPYSTHRVLSARAAAIAASTDCKLSDPGATFQKLSKMFANVK